ncbi:LSU ribosomal protein L3p (L3e) [hydrothermal vent metagenome]|uniref:LSU ribosomal protein L3p (L3e) n=1 Tax=hydrothermal vent metagenome TaxID=652676 RepID=A0A1W1BKR8_9ZZZZ
MALGLIGQKIGMTRVLSDDGSAVAVSVLKVEDMRVVQNKTIDIDGYNALQVTTGQKVNKKGEAKVRYVSSALKGHYKKAKQSIGLGLWEFRTDDVFEGDKIGLDLVAQGCFVDVQGISKGKGFQGGVKRHNFSMQDATHGNSISHRALGSTGQCQTPGRVFKGKKMAGHMGAETVTTENLEVVRVDLERNLLLIKGAVPGAKTGFVKIFLSHKKKSFNDGVLKKAVNDKASVVEEVKE